VIVAVDTGAGRVELEEPSDCARFHVVATGEPDGARLGQVLAGQGVGRTEGDGALIEIAAVRGLAAGRVGDEWETDFTVMLEYARAKGWLAGSAIRAHVEWV
jgi:hypothetical protein